jgi:alpha-tubulin suppressor-like RCC1 family protein
VRTDPPPQKVDVPLNSIMGIVFSEPIDSTTLNTGAVQLWRGTTPVPGTVRFTDAAGIRAEFRPDSLLSSQTAYRLVVTQTIRDANGEVLAAPVAVPFTTVTAGPLGTITVTPSPVTLASKGTQRFSAVGTDAGGNVVAIAPTWSVAAGGGTIDSSGLFTAGGVSGTFTNTVQATIGSISGQATVTVTAKALATITVAPNPVTLAAGGTQQFTATGKDSGGTLVAIAPTWSVTAGGGAIDSSGRFTAGGVPGTFVNTVQATSGSISGRATVIVASGGALATITVTPNLVTLAVNGTLQFTAVGKDAAGNIVAISPTWSADSGAGTISSSGLFTAGTVPGVFQWAVSAFKDGEAWGYATVTVTSAASAGLLFAAVTAGGQHTCGVATTGAAYCWGDNTHGALGNGTTANSLTPMPVPLALPFYELSAGGTHTCGTTPSPYPDNYVTYCWGGNGSGQLGDGTTVDRLSPQAVGNSQVVMGAIISSGGNHTCLLDLWNFGFDYCWGANESGQLGDGTTIGRTSPVDVQRVGYTPFGNVTAGGSHTCAEAGGFNYPSHSWYCWGANSNGQLGDGTTTDRTSWVLVGEGMSFGYGAAQSGVSAGARHTCGVTYVGAAYCWGLNSSGELGDGTTSQRTSPTLVAGGLSFVDVRAGGSHTCGITVAGVAYCWGANDHGQLGDGTTTQRMSPVAVAGGLTFALPGFPYNGTLSAGSGHTCGITTAGVMYCWGSNSSGQLGNGATTDSSVPVRVTGSASPSSARAPSRSR